MIAQPNLGGDDRNKTEAITFSRQPGHTNKCKQFFKALFQLQTE